MKIIEIRDTYYEASAKASDLARQFSLAGIAVIWILRVGDKTGGIKYSGALLIPLVLFVLSLVTDFLQYFYKTIAWALLNNHHWKKWHDNEKDIAVSARWNWPTWFFWGSKFVLFIAAYCFLIRFIYSQI